MGVMPCSRKGCENILCSKYSTKYGYICDSCFAELMNTLVSIGYFMRFESIPTRNIEQHQKSVMKEFFVNHEDLNGGK
jgi:hypothetical protein